nr:FG-GAP-like repeat-containing protein [Pseudomonadota bacterium]
MAGNSNGRLVLLRNDGDAAAAAWVAAGEATDAAGAVIDVGGYATPYAADIDGDGDADLLVGNSGGQIVWYRNDAGPAGPSWVRVGTVTLASGTTLDVGDYARPVLYDDDGTHGDRVAGDGRVAFADAAGAIQVLERSGQVWPVGG